MNTYQTIGDTAQQISLIISRREQYNNKKIKLGMKYVVCFPGTLLTVGENAYNEYFIHTPHPSAQAFTITDAYNITFRISNTAGVHPSFIELGDYLDRLQAQLQQQLMLMSTVNHVNVYVPKG